MRYTESHFGTYVLLKDWNVLTYQIWLWERGQSNVLDVLLDSSRLFVQWYIRSKLRGAINEKGIRSGHVGYVGTPLHSKVESPRSTWEQTQPGQQWQFLFLFTETTCSVDICFMKSRKIVLW